MVIRESSQASGTPSPAPVPAEGPGSRVATGTNSGAAGALAPLLRALLGTELPVRFEFWDGSGIGPVGGPGTIRVNSVDAVRRMLWAPGELGVARAFVAGDLSLEGDLFAMLRVLHDTAPRDLRKMGLRALPPIVDAARRLGAIGPPLPAPAEECRPTGRLHSLGRDAKVISHHYDVGNDFYRLFLGPRMTYSCARFVSETSTLEEAQDAKHELICRKLGLDQHPGSRLLDVGCGWGSMAIHAAQHHQASVVGVALSSEQVDLAQERVKAAGLDDRIEIRLQDYRELKGEQFDAISSIGMFEHVGTSAMALYFTTLRDLLGPTGRLLNHAISSPGGSVLGRRTFIGRYVFPDGELLDVGEVILAMQRAGFEVRDVESLREHYAKTLRAWVANLEEGWDQAVALVGERRANIWRFYMAASANGFDDAGLAIHQVLGVISEPDGVSGMPPTRTGWS
ncbi:MAG TPA: cyclopropane-fatty-acyl-phospholipid synthase family protein [Acidimicrobiales bacterium]|nr:cyclopropane-fatty-acyl-phospholipid synthase family protein [Acidimicrobiales bacterium]